MEYIELTVHTSTAASELVADIMWNYTELGVAISDVNDIIELSKMKRKMWDYMEEGLDAPHDVLVKAYFEPTLAENAIKGVVKNLATLKENCEFELGSLETVRRTVDGDAWLNTWKEHFKPIKLDNVVICPEWIDYLPKDNETVVKIDANMAFGTGEHETTSMCIELLQKYLKDDKSVVDVGCGSGILGLTAAKLGCKKVIMTDIDPQAVEAAKRNAVLNGVTADIAEKNLLDDVTVKGDIILANIMAEILVDFAPKIGGNLNKGGIIILSGILDTKLELVTTAYAAAGFTPLDAVKKGEWCAAVFGSKE